MIYFNPTGFDSFSEYLRFAFAREFRNRRTYEKISYIKKPLEQWGDLIVNPIMKVSDYSICNIRNPKMIFSIGLTAAAAATVLFYPEKSIDFFARTIPVIGKIQPWIIKAGLYTTWQLIILGICMRTLGRLDPSGDLWRAWDQSPRQIIPIAIGTQIEVISNS